MTSASTQLSAQFLHKFTEMDDECNHGGDNGGEPLEMKYVPVKTEVIDDYDDDANDYFVDVSFEDGGDKETDSDENEEDVSNSAGRRTERLSRTQGQSPKKRMKQTVKLPGVPYMYLSRNEKAALRVRKKRAEMTPEEKEKQREKWKLEKQQKRKLEKQRQEEEKGLRALVGEDEEDDKQGRRSSRPSRLAKLKTSAKIKAEPIDNDVEDNDDEYQMEREEDSEDSDTEVDNSRKKRTPRKSSRTSRSVSRPKSSAGGGYRKKKVSEMSEEERERMKEKWRLEAREKRARQRAALGGGGGDSKVKIGGRRKRVSEMSEEERERMKEKWRLEARERRARQRAALGGGGDGAIKNEVVTESNYTTSSSERPLDIPEKLRDETRQKRHRKRESMTPEQYEERLRIQRDQKRERRAQMTQAEREECNRRRQELRKFRKALMTPEQKQEEQQKETIRRILYLSRMSDEQKKRRNLNKYMFNATKRSQMTLEELEESRKRKREYYRMRRNQMSEEELNKWRETCRRCMQRRRDMIKQDPVKLEEMKKVWKKQRESHWQRKGRFRKRNVSRIPSRKTQERNKRNQRVHRLRKKLEIKKLLDDGLTVEEIQAKMKKETPEHREQRLIKQRIRDAKNRLKKKLENEGACPEEIERRCQELEVTYQPNMENRPIKPYKPRGWDNIDAGQLSMLVENFEKNPTIDLKPVEQVPSETSPSKRRQRSPKKQHQIDGVSSSYLQKQPQFSGPASSSSSGTGAYQQVPAEAHSSHQYHYQVPLVYPHQQSQSPSSHLQAYSHSLQTILDGITYQESRGASTSGPSIIAHQHSQDHYSDDYSSNYNDHASPLASPIGGDDDNYSSDDNSPNDYSNYFDNALQNPEPPPSASSSISKRGRPRNDEPPRSKIRKPRPTSGKGRTGPRGGRSKKGPQDCVCDECGNAYSRHSLPIHKARHHNPDYKDQTCQICQEKFVNSQFWYQHWCQNHKPTAPHKTTHMCDLCGQGFQSSGYLSTHKYYRHGDGLKKENYFRCPVCPEEKLFKQKISLNSHLKKFHPEYKRDPVGGHLECYRCDKTFFNSEDLKSHVKEEHPDSYFPCQFCSAVKFSRHAVFLHYIWCKKFPRDRRKEFRDKEAEEMEGMVGLYRLPLPCEFCGRMCALSSLHRHFWEMHDVREEEFRCAEAGCGKMFKRREYWAVHLEEIHRKGVEELKGYVGKLNAKEGVEVKNLKGKQGGVRFNTRKKLGNLMDEEAGKRRRKRAKEEEESSSSSSSEEEEWSGEDEEREGQGEFTGRGRRKQRNVVVICEEDDEEDSGD